MTPLRFRFWDSNEKRMCNDCTLELLKELSPSLNDVFGTLEHKGCVVMQSTGRHDKNGVEVFESDVVGFQNKHMDKPELWGVVKWDDSRLCWSVSMDRDSRSLGIALHEAMDDGVCDDGLLIVYGNIYENPDLLPKAA